MYYYSICRETVSNNIFQIFFKHLYHNSYIFKSYLYTARTVTFHFNKNNKYHCITFAASPIFLNFTKHVFKQVSNHI